MARGTDVLGVWLDGLRVAELRRRGPVGLVCRYSAEALGRWPRNVPLLSCSLPLTDRPADARVFAKQLLPEGRALQVLADRAGLATVDTFGLLDRYGRDVAGALVIGAEAPDPVGFGVEVYADDAALATAVAGLEDNPLGVDDDSELSLAGLQDKLLLVRLDDGRWGRPLHGRPSTHILKRDDLRRRGLVAAEAACLALARAVGLTTIDPQLRRYGDDDCLIVDRFDRRPGPDGIVRVHQEDLCQATGVDGTGMRGRGKYERAGGPGFAAAATLLEAHAARPADELRKLVAAMTFTVAIGNADAHAKNVALLHPEPGTVRLAPLYDTVPTRLWPKLRADAAMRVAGRDPIDAITAADLVAEARGWPVPRAVAVRVVTETAERLLAAIQDGAIEPQGDVAQLVLPRAERIAREAAQL